MTAVISVHQLGKKYTLSHQAPERYTALRDVLANGARHIAKRVVKPFSSKPAIDPLNEEFWALKNVSFDIQQGDRVGIVGRNGAGKSTLLKVLSRITEPTEGKVKIRGRVASLLEVGTGFHPELTGRENIYLNGAILGMSNAEIKRKFDEIVDFADIERFLDTPVKRFSSGMYVRLAFSVAAHLESEVLILDEVLAVGDMQFQEKCLKRMENITSNDGRTILFVSHNLQAVSAICNKGILIADGRMVAEGGVADIIDLYVRERPKGIGLRARLDRVGSGVTRVVGMSVRQKLVDVAGSRELVLCGKHTEFIVEVESDETALNKPIRIVLIIVDKNGNRLLPFVSEWVNPSLTVESKCQQFTIEVPDGLNLMPGMYSITVGVAVNGIVSDKVERAFEFESGLGDYFTSGTIPNDSLGLVLAPFSCSAI